MKHFIAAISMAAFVAAAAPASAETIDIATVKCSDLATMKDEDGAFLFVWLAGYMGGQESSTTMNLDDMGPWGESIGKYCAENPDVGLISAAQNAE